MIQHHKWRLSDIESLVPFERQVYVLLLQHIEDEKLRMEQERKQ